MISRRLAAFVVCLGCAATAHADIYRWDNGQLIPGTEGITPEPGVQLSSPNGEWNTEARNLWFAGFVGADLSGARFSNSWLDDADFSAANLANTSLDQTTLANANLTDANLTNANLRNADLTGASLQHAKVVGAEFTGAVVAGADLRGVGNTEGLTREQLYSTASYQNKNLAGIVVGYGWGVPIDLSGWDFSGQNLMGAAFGQRFMDFGAVNNLSEADFSKANLAAAKLGGTILSRANLSGADLSYAEIWGADLTDANLSSAVITGGHFDRTTEKGFTKEQLYSTQSYQTKNLTRILFTANDLSSWDFSGQNLADASFSNSTLTNANLARANLANVSFSESALTSANLTGANLANAYLENSTLTSANLTGAVVTGASLGGATSRGFTKEQLYSTQSYQAKDLAGIGLHGNDLTGWDFSGQDLAGARFHQSTLTNANLAGAVVDRASFADTTSRGFTKDQLYSTQSYQTKNLAGIGLEDNDLTGWDFSGQNLAGARFHQSTLRNANLTGAVVTGANFQFTTREGFTKEQLYSTQSYQEKNLAGIRLVGNDLSDWDFSGQDLADASFDQSALTTANLTRANLADANLESSTLTNANLTGAVVNGANFWNTTAKGFTKEQLYSTQSYQAKDLAGIVFGDNDLSGWDFSGQNLTNASFHQSTLTNANLTGAVVTGAYFWNTTSRGFTKEQLYSTQSYQAKDLAGIGLDRNDLTGWDFSGRDLAGASLQSSTLSSANLTGAVVTGANFGNTTSKGFTKEQLYSTQSYQAKNLAGIGLDDNDLTGWDVSGQNLANAGLRFSWLTNANLTGAVVTGASFGGATSRGFTKEQLYSTQSYQAKDLAGIRLDGNHLRGWDFSGQDLANARFSESTLSNANLTRANLANANLWSSTLTNAKLTGAVVNGASFGGATSRGFTKEQLYSTQSYQAKNLAGIGLDDNDLTGWDFSGQNLANAGLRFSWLTNANLTGAVVTGAYFWNTTSKGFTKEQLYSTQSYRAKDLAGIGLDGNDLTGWDFSGQNLAGAYLWSSTLINANLSEVYLVNAYLASSTLTNANLTGADARGARGLNLAGATSRNAILPDGHIAGLSLASGDRLIVRDDDGVAADPPQSWITPRAPIAITVHDQLAMSDDGMLQLLIEADAWDSLISFEPGIPVQLGGTLELSFVDDVNVAAQVGRTLRIFDWTGVAPVGRFTVDGPYGWDTSRLYTTGEVTLLAVPEPIAAGLAIIAATMLLTLRIGWRNVRLIAWTAALPLAFLGSAPIQSQTFTLAEATVAEINAAFDDGILTSERLVQLYLNRIEAYDDAGPALNTILTLNPAVLETARALDIERRTAGPRSLLHGIPILLKDQLDVAGLPTTSGALALRDSYPPDDAFLVRRLRDAGAIILGKTNLDEFTCCSVSRSSLGGQSRNPYDVTRVTGGSSGGTAAAIAANFATIGTGSDWWGSIQEPSALQSLVGVTPTRSLISGDGAMPPSSERRGVTGPMARSVADAAAMLEVIVGVDPNDPVTAASAGRIPPTYRDALDPQGLQGARIGLVQNYLPALGGVRTLINAAVADLQYLGAEIVPVLLTTPSNLNSMYYNDLEYGANRYLESLGPDRQYQDFQELLDSGETLPVEQRLNGDVRPEDDPKYAAVVSVREAFEATVLKLMDDSRLDALLYPPLLSSAPLISSAARIWESNADFRNMNVAPFLGFPSITVPAGFLSLGAAGASLPVGITLLGRPFSEPTLISLAYAYEQATQHRRPPAVTPPLPGETVPEPSSVLLAAAAMGCVLSVRRRIYCFSPRAES